MGTTTFWMAANKSFCCLRWLRGRAQRERGRGVWTGSVSEKQLVTYQ